MCGPIGIALIGAAGSIYSGMAASAAAQGQAAVYKAQEKAMQYQAQSERNAGSMESGIKLDEGKRLLGKQITGLAATGIVVSSGSGGDIITDSASAVNMDVAAIRHNWQDKSNLSIYNSKIAKLNAKTSQTQAKMAMIGGAIGAAGSLAKGISLTDTSSSFTSNMVGLG